MKPRFQRYKSFVARVDTELEAADRRQHKRIMAARDELKKEAKAKKDAIIVEKPIHGMITLEDGKLTQIN